MSGCIRVVTTALRITPGSAQFAGLSALTCAWKGAQQMKNIITIETEFGSKIESVLAG